MTAGDVTGCWTVGGLKMVHLASRVGVHHLWRGFRQTPGQSPDGPPIEFWGLDCCFDSVGVPRLVWFVTLLRATLPGPPRRSVELLPAIPAGENDSYSQRSLSRHRERLRKAFLLPSGPRSRSQGKLSVARSCRKQSFD